MDTKRDKSVSMNKRAQAHRNKNSWCRVLRTQLLFLVAAFLCSSARPASAVPAPRMPKRFDKATVEKLVQTIDKDFNAVILKHGYFGSASPQDFSVPRGYELLQAAARKQPLGTPRWFVMSSVQAYAGLFRDEKTRAAATTLYGTIFDAYARAPQEANVKTAQRSIYEFLHAIPSDGQVMSASSIDMKQGKPVFLKALNAYIVLLNQNKPYKVALPWMEAVVALDVSPEATDMVSKALESSKGAPKLPTLYLLAAKVYEPTAPEKAAQLRQKSDEVMADIRRKR